MSLAIIQPLALFVKACYNKTTINLSYSATFLSRLTSLGLSGIEGSGVTRNKKG